MTWYCIDVDRPVISDPVLEYTIFSPFLNPWFSNVIVLFTVDTPTGLIFNLRLLYPLPESNTLTDFKVFWDSNILNLWIPFVAIVVNPTVLIPDLKSAKVSYNRIELNPTTCG